MKTGLDYIRILDPKFAQGGKNKAVSRLCVNRYDVVEGRVVRLVPPNHAVLAVQDQRVLAQTKVPLQEGDVISFKVLQIDPRYVFQVMDWKGRPPIGATDYTKFCHLNGFPYKSLFDLLRPPTHGQVGPRGDMADHLFRIGQMLEDMTVVPDRKESAATVKHNLRNAGMFWEGKLGSVLESGAKGLVQLYHLMRSDLKGTLLRSVANFPDGEAPGLETIRKCLDGLEQLQLLNASAFEDKGKCLFVIPVRFKGDYSFAQLLVDLSDEHGSTGAKQERKETYRIQLLLDMSELGAVHVDVSVLGKVLKINFLVGEETVQGRVEDATPDLTQTLEGAGFTVQQVKCRCAGSQASVPASLVDEILDQERHRISLVV